MILNYTKIKLGLYYVMVRLCYVDDIILYYYYYGQNVQNSQKYRDRDLYIERDIFVSYI